MGRECGFVSVPPPRLCTWRGMKPGGTSEAICRGKVPPISAARSKLAAQGRSPLEFWKLSTRPALGSVVIGSAKESPAPTGANWGTVKPFSESAELRDRVGETRQPSRDISPATDGQAEIPLHVGLMIGKSGPWRPHWHRSSKELVLQRLAQPNWEAFCCVGKALREKTSAWAISTLTRSGRWACGIIARKSEQLLSRL
jgi:hypothetical protein